MTTGDRGTRREHYDNADTSTELDKAEFTRATIGEPMVGITIRLPASTLDAARRLARKEGLKVTALLRRWIEENVAEGADDEQMIPVAELKRLIAKSRFPATFGPDVEVEEVDLDTTEVTYRGGLLTEARAEAVADEVLKRAHRGRPPTSPPE